MISTKEAKRRFKDREETKLAVMTTSNVKPRVPRPFPRIDKTNARPTRDVRGLVMTNTNYREIVAKEKGRTYGERIANLRKQRKAVLAKRAAKPAPAKTFEEKPASKKGGKKGA